MAAADHEPSSMPMGTVTFMLTDIEGSTRMWEAAPDWAGAAMARQRALIDSAVTANRGVRPEEQGEGDSTVSVFRSAAGAVAAALAAQRALAAESWPGGITLRVRIGVHTGEGQLRDERNYAGVTVHRCARLRDIGHGGQTVVSSVTASLVADSMPDDSWLADRGSHRLRDLSTPEHVFELRHPDLDDDFPPLRSLDALANNLPGQLTTFIGRDDELAAINKLLESERMVTLTGSGGCGKTRLALQAAAGAAERWPDGTWWIDLAAIADPGLVADVAASTMRILVEPVSGPLQALKTHLRDKHLLVCLDNCEHLLDACAELADTLLRDCPHVSVLATSREPVGVAGEAVWRVPSMGDDHAVRLFSDRAALVRPGFAVDATNVDAVNTICARLDGIPLAIELAAAWVRALTPAQIAAGLDDRFRLLAGGPRGLMPRQQTLAASVEWSHDLLEEPDRVVLRRLAVFAGGFPLAAAQRVCAADPLAETDVLVSLAGLVDKSLVIADERSGEVRYRLLETIRHYAGDRLDDAGESAATRDRHLGHYLELATTAEPELEGADQDAWLDRLETEHDNLRAALDWGLSAADPDRGRQLTAALPRLWILHGHAHRGIEYLQRALAADPDDRSTLQARLLFGIAFASAVGGRFELVGESARRGVEIAAASDDDSNRARCLAISAYVGYFADFAAARERCIEARQYAEAVGDDLAIDLALVLEALTWINCARHENARPLLDEAVERCTRRGDRLLGTFALRGQGLIELFTGDVRRAERLTADALELAEPLGDSFTVGSAASMLAWVKGTGGDLVGAMELMDSIVRSVEAAGPDVDVPPMAWVLGKLYLWMGDVDSAIAWCERGSRYGEPLIDNLVVGWARLGLAAALRRLGRADEARREIERAAAIAATLDMPHVVAEALDESARLIAIDDPERSESVHHKALAIRVEHGLRTYYVDSLDALARLAANAGSHAEAVRLLAASDVARDEMGYPRPPIDVPDHEAWVVGLCDALGDAFGDAYAEGAAIGLDEAVAYATRARGSRDRPSTGWASLTPTEREVVGLVVGGLTNPEIGARLFVSRATVKTHLSHIYAKLGVANRTELATLASSSADPD